MRGALLDADDVRETWERALRRLRAGVLAVTSRVRSRLPHLSAGDAQVLDEEIRSTLTALADGDGG